MEETKEQGKFPNSERIYGAIAGVIADVGHVAKDKVNKQQGFKFRSIDDVYNVLHPALAKNRVFIVPKILKRTSEVIGKTKNGADMIKVVCEIEYTFFAEDGSSVTAIIIGEGLDTGDKATNKAMAIAYKYACFQVFCIPTEEMMADPDSESIELDKGKPENGKSKAVPTKTSGKSSVRQKCEREQGVDSQETAPEETKITDAMLNTIRAEQVRTGVADEQILSMRAVKAKTIPEMTVVEFKAVMSKFERTPDLTGGGRGE